MRWPSPPGERGGGTVQRDITQADLIQKLQPLDDFVDNTPGDDFFRAQSI